MFSNSEISTRLTKPCSVAKNKYQCLSSSIIFLLILINDLTLSSLSRFNIFTIGKPLAVLPNSGILYPFKR